MKKVSEMGSQELRTSRSPYASEVLRLRTVQACLSDEAEKLNWERVE